MACNLSAHTFRWLTSAWTELSDLTKGADFCLKAAASDFTMTRLVSVLTMLLSIEDFEGKNAYKVTTSFAPTARFRDESSPAR